MTAPHLPHMSRLKFAQRDAAMKITTMLSLMIVALLHGTCADIPKRLQFESMFPDASFDTPVAFFIDPQDKDVAYIAGNRGKIWRARFSNGGKTKEEILDISDKTGPQRGETGIFDMIAHPDFASNKKVLITYTNEKPKEDRLSSFTIAANGVEIDSEIIHLKLDRPHESGTIGHIAFGPDGHLYVGVSDGGRYDDTKNNSQDLSTLFGSILRIDLGSMNAGYKVPLDNPFMNVPGAKGEIWAYGLRVPWRFSFDKKTGVLYCADVGQSRREEINIIVKGGNYGWPVKEGTLEHEAPRKDGEIYINPIAEYGRDVGLAVIGGYVYRGRIKELDGIYVYCDFLTDNFWGLWQEGDTVSKVRKFGYYNYSVTSFYQDAAGEIYLCSLSKGNVFKISGLK